MLSYRNLKIVGVLLSITIISCTKLDEKLRSNLTSDQTANALGAAGTDLLLQTAYKDIGGPFLNDQGQVLSLQENSSDLSLVPTRGGDWDDNGSWRIIHAHQFNADDANTLNCFNNLNKLNFDATNVLAFNPSASQSAQARFLRALSLYTLLDIFNQYPIRQPGENLLNAPEVKTGAPAIQFIIDELTAIIPDLVDGGVANMAKANKDAARTLLMKCYLNRGAFINRAAPTFDDADMQQVITLGTAIAATGYSYMSEYFANFAVTNKNSTEGIFAYPNRTDIDDGIRTRWFMTLHYNQYTPNNPNAGWNGFSTVADFYNSFGVPTPLDAQHPNPVTDPLVDQRIGGRPYPGVTDKSGQRPGLMIGQQYNENNTALKDRKGNPLYFDPNIAPDMKETGPNLEVTGIRVEKYPPDFTGGSATYSAKSGNWFMIFRISDVNLMVAEAMTRLAHSNDVTGPALQLVNDLRTARDANTVASMTLVNTSNLNDPTTLLAERGRELYWESQRRPDLIRFGMFLKPWAYKPNDDPKYLVFPVPNQALAANPNLVQNPGYE
jgi:starch-binding outer membrane protein, SusD/RagB family